MMIAHPGYIDPDCPEVDETSMPSAVSPINGRIPALNISKSHSAIPALMEFNGDLFA